MRIESMIYIYGAVCLSMILFNVVYNLLLNSSRLRLERRCGAVRVRLLPQLIRLRQGLGVEEKHLVYLEHALRREKNLMAFDQVLKDLLQRGDEELETAYLAGKVERLAELKVNLCMECGCCSHGCPASRPLVQTNKLAKAQVAAWKAAKKAADEATLRM